MRLRQHLSQAGLTLVLRMQPARTPRKPAQHIARALGAASHVSATPRPKSSPTHSPPDSPRSTGDFSTFSDGDWEENLADNVKVCKLDNARLNRSATSVVTSHSVAHHISRAALCYITVNWSQYKQLQ